MPLPEPLPIPCLRLPPLPVPTLPAPLTLGVTLPAFNFDPALCCKILPFEVALPPVPLPPGVLNPAVVASVNQALAAMSAYFDQFQFSCPLE